MKFKPADSLLKNGETVIIREAQKRDAEGLLKTVSTYISNSAYLLTSIEEFNPTIQEEARWIQQLAESPNCLLLVALHHHKIVGNLDLKPGPQQKTRHNAIIGLGVLKEWQNMGLGQALMERAIDWSREHSIIETLWLHVFASHQAAIHLYQKLGFELAAIQKNYIKNRDGSYTDNHIMRLNVSKF